MPYIRKEQRQRIDIEMFDGFPRLENAGELNYFISTAIINYVTDHGLEYRILNDVVGALEGAKAEFQRRVVAPYEDKKAEDNGDMPWPSS